MMPAPIRNPATHPRSVFRRVPPSPRPPVMASTAVVDAGARRRLQRYIPMLLSRHRVHFVFQHAQGADHAGPGLARLDHIVDESLLGGDERIGEALAEFGDLL